MKTRVIILFSVFFCFVEYSYADIKIINKIRGFYNNYRNVGYDYGGCDSRVMDCSCFVQKLYKDLFGMNIGRTTLEQTTWLEDSKAYTIKNRFDLNPVKLQPGDLIYSYQNKWMGRRNTRHVVLYAGKGKIIHSSTNNDGVDEDSISWLKRFKLYGVYRPLYADPQQGRVSVLAKPIIENNVTSVIHNIFVAWESRDLSLYKTCWSRDAMQYIPKSIDADKRRSYNEIIARVANVFSRIKSVKQKHKILSVEIKDGSARVEVQYSLYLYTDSYQSRLYHKGPDINVLETYILHKENGIWQIKANYDYNNFR